MKLKILETYNASSSFRTENDPDNVAANWFGNKKVGNATLNDYMRYEKGQDANIVYMTPNEYLERCAKDIFNSTYEKTVGNIKKYNSGIISKYAKDMLNGDKFPLPYLDYVYKQQEGRHRALAVIEAFGEDSIMPVIVIRPTDPTEQELKQYAEQRWPEDPEWGLEYVKGKYDKFNSDYTIEDETNDLDNTETNYNDTDFNIDDELDSLFDDLDEEDFVKFINQKYGKNFTSIVEIDNTLFSKALDDYYDT
jgi:hypothetical protein